MRANRILQVPRLFLVLVPLLLIAIPTLGASVWEDLASFGKYPASSDARQADLLARRLLQSPDALAKRLRTGLSLPIPVRAVLLTRLRFGIHQEGKDEWAPLLELLDQKGDPTISVIGTHQGTPLGQTSPRSSAGTVPPSVMKSLTEVSKDGRTLVFRAAGSRRGGPLAAIKPGAVLIGGPSRQFPEGCARRVISVSSDHRRLQVRTEPLSLDELLEGGSGMHSNLRPADIESASLETGPNERLPSFSVGDPTAEATAFDGLTTLPGGSVDVSSHWRSPNRESAGNLWEQVKKAAVFSTGLSLQFRNAGLGTTLGIKILDPILVVRKDELSFRGRLMFDASVGLRPVESLSFKHALLTLKLKPIPVGFCGPVPIWIRPKIRLILKGRVSGDIGCEGTFSCEAPLLACLRMVDGRWRNDSTATIEARTQGLKLDGAIGHIGAKLFVGTSVGLAINDLAGPTLRSGVYLSFGAVSTLTRASPGTLPKPLLTLFKVKGGAEVAIGGALEFLRNAEFLATIFRAEVPLYKLKYAGIELIPDVMPLHGNSFDPGSVIIRPLYRERVLEKDRGMIRLATIPGAAGHWTPPMGDSGLIDLSSTLGNTRPERTALSLGCSLPLVDANLTGRGASFTLVLTP